VLLNRLNSDRSIAPLVAQFVPLKIDTGTQEWQQWARKYKHEGSTIPKIFVIRADGTMLYGKSGMLSGNALPTMLIQALRSAGEIYNNKETTTLISTVEKAKKAYEDGNKFEAVRTISTTKKLGKLGELKSYAKPAIEANQLVKQLNEDGSKALIDTKEIITNSNNPLEGVIEFVETQRIYTLLPIMKIKLTRAMREHQQTTAFRDLLTQAEMFNRARVQVNSKRYKNAGLISLKKIVSRYPNTAIAKLAQAEYEKLSDDSANKTKTAEKKPDVSETEPTKKAKSASVQPIRIWKDTSGEFEIKARLIEIKKDSVVLKKEDNTVVEVPLSKLSDQDKKYCRDLFSLELP